METELGFRLHPHSRVIEQGRVGGAVALLQARRMMTEGRSARVIVAGVDSYLNGATLAHYDAEHRLLTRSNSNGFVPGEAAAALLLGLAAQGGSAPLVLQGLGFGREPAPFGSGKPLRAEGLLRAMRGALDEAGMPLSACDHRIADVNGEQYRFREVSLAIMRLLRDPVGLVFGTLRIALARSPRPFPRCSDAACWCAKGLSTGSEFCRACGQ